MEAKRKEEIKQQLTDLFEKIKDETDIDIEPLIRQEIRDIHNCVDKAIHEVYGDKISNIQLTAFASYGLDLSTKYLIGMALAFKMDEQEQLTLIDKAHETIRANFFKNISEAHLEPFTE